MVRPREHMNELHLQEQKPCRRHTEDETVMKPVGRIECDIASDAKFISLHVLTTAQPAQDVPCKWITIAHLRFVHMFFFSVSVKRCTHGSAVLHSLVRVAIRFHVFSA